MKQMLSLSLSYYTNRQQLIQYVAASKLAFDDVQNRVERCLIRGLITSSIWGKRTDYLLFCHLPPCTVQSIYSWSMVTGPFLQVPVVDADDNIMKMAAYGPLAPPLPPPPQECLTTLTAGDSKIIAAPESCPPTTIVIQKILTSIRQEDMLSLLDSFCRETNLPHQPNDSAEFEFFPKHEHPIAASMSNDIEIDYVHMPLSRKGLHKGFAVVNFTKFKAALMFNAIHHKRAVEIGAHTSFVCEVAFAAIQGVEAHLQKWRLGSTPSLNHVSQEPLLFNPPCNGFVNCLSDRLQGQKLSTLSPSTATSSSSMLSPALATDMEGDVGSGSPWHLSSSPLSLQSLPSALKANSAPTATKSCVKKEERKRGSLQGKIMNVEGVQMGSSKKRSGKDHVVAWPMNMTSMRMRGKLAAPSSNESVPRKKRKKFQKEKAKYEGSAATSTSSSLVQQTVASRLAQIEEEDKDHEDAIPLRQSFAWIYNGVLRFLWRSGLSKLSVSQIVMYVKQN